MRTNDEMAGYLEELLEHERTCGVADCTVCQCAQNIYRLVRNVIFSGVVYPEVTIAARGRVIGARNSADRTTAFSLAHVV